MLISWLIIPWTLVVVSSAARGKVGQRRQSYSTNQEQGVGFSKKNAIFKRDNPVDSEPVQTIEDKGNYAEGAPYNYKYEIKDHDTQFSQKVNSDGEVVTGEYRVRMPDGRTQVVSYTADWKNGYRAKVTYEGGTLPVRPQNGGENSFRPGGFPTKKSCPPGQQWSEFQRKCTALNEADGQFQPGGQPMRCPPNYFVGRNGRCVPDEGEKDIKPGGYYPTPKPCPPGSVINSQGTCVTDESETDIKPGGYHPKPKPCPPGSYIDSEGNCVRDERETDIKPGGYYPKPKPCPPGSHIDSEGKCFPYESETDIQPGGYLPKPKRCPPGTLSDSEGKCIPDEGETDIQPGGSYPTPKPCPPGYARYPGKGYSNCQQVYSTTTRETRAPGPSQSLPNPDNFEQGTLPTEFGPTTPRTPCSTMMNSGKCRRILPPRLIGEKDKCIAANRDPRVCYPELCYPGSRHDRCKRPSVDEQEEDIQAAGSLPATPPSEIMPQKISDKAKCVAKSKDPKVCFPELCYPGSQHPRCGRNNSKTTTETPLIDESEEDIQAAGAVPSTEPPPKPMNLYGTPDVPFGVRLNAKFGYY